MQCLLPIRTPSCRTCLLLDSSSQKLSSPSNWPASSVRSSSSVNPRSYSLRYRSGIERRGSFVILTECIWINRLGFPVLSVRITWASSAHDFVATRIREKGMSKQCASTAKRKRWPRTLSSTRNSRGLSVVKVRSNSIFLYSLIQCDWISGHHLIESTELVGSFIKPELKSNKIYLEKLIKLINNNKVIAFFKIKNDVQLKACIGIDFNRIYFCYLNMYI